MTCTQGTSIPTINRLIYMTFVCRTVNLDSRGVVLTVEILQLLEAEYGISYTVGNIVITFIEDHQWYLTW